MTEDPGDSTAKTRLCLIWRAEAGETLLLVLFLAGILVHRLLLVGTEAINPDELFFIGGGYRLGAGLTPYLDFVDARTPLSLAASRYLVERIGERPDFLIRFRLVQFGLVLLLHLTMFLAVRRAFGAKVALWSLCIVNSFLFFVTRTVHLRPDVPAFVLLFGSLHVLLGREEGRAGSRLLAAGIGFGLAASFHMTALFPLAAVLLWLYLVDRRVGSGHRALLAPLLFGAAASAAFLGSFVPLFGARTPEAVLAFRRVFPLDRAYQALMGASGLVSREVFRLNLLPWLLVAAALVAYNRSWLGRGLRRSDTLLFVLLADLGVVFLLLRAYRFQQHYLFVSVFGGVLAAMAIRGWVKRAGARWQGGWKGRLGAATGLLSAGMFVLISWALLAVAETERRAEGGAERRSLERMWTPVPKPDGALPTETALRWLAVRSRFFDPFRYRPIDQRMAQLRFLLRETRPGDIVYSDWLNPPFRELPAPYPHGLVLSLFYYRAERLADDAALVRIVRRFDPHFPPAAVEPGDRLIGLFETRPPALILLDGSMAELFCKSERFRNWIGMRYRLVPEPESGSVFAVRREAR